MNALSRLFLVGLLSFGVTACEVEDVGTDCGTDASAGPPDPIGGEEPTLETVRLERDGACESFQCLRHRGYSPYCTRECEYVGDAASAPECTAQVDCPNPLRCIDGLCRDDDCPTGFECRTVQNVGPLTGQLFCVAQEGCATNFDCEELGRVKCDRVACHDVCLTDSSCAYHALVCVDPASLPCQCPDAATSCTDAELTCQGTTDAEPWDAGSVNQRGVCRLEAP